MKDDYVSRQAATEEACKGCNIEFFDEGCEPSDCEIRNRLQNITAADVRKNVRGEWIDCGVHGDWAWEMDGHGNCWHIWKCSKCEYKTEHCSNFCPNCGAQMMRGEA